jgi:[ribosomal protein S5]-alanine N-acetyltransferase
LHGKIGKITPQQLIYLTQTTIKGYSFASFYPSVSYLHLMHPFQALSTARLSLRPLTNEDLAGIFALRSNEEVCRYIGRPPLQDLAGAQAFIDRIAIKETGELAGTICLWNISDDETTAEVGSEMLPAHQGKGYMHEAMAAVIDYSFDAMQLHAIEAFTHKDNERSRHLLQKSGFTLCEGRTDPDVPANCVYRKEAGAAS